MAWKWGIDLDTRGVRRGADDAADAVEDLVDVMDDVARESDRSSDQVERDLDGVGDEAQDSARRVEREFRDAFDEIQNSSRRTFDDVGDNARDGMDDASEGVENFRDEADGTAREVAASFDGSIDSIAGGFQELSANALAGFGPAGAAAGLALAAGIGAFWTTFQENSEKAKQQISDMYDDMIESGENFLSKSFVADQLKEIYGDTEDARISWEALKEIVDLTGLSVETVARAFAGDAEAGVLLTDNLNAALAQQADDANKAAQSGERLGKAYYDQNVALNEAVDLWNGVGGQIETAAERANGYRKAATDAGIVSVRSADEARAAYDGLGRKINELPSSKTVKVGADTGEFDREIARIQSRVVRVNVAPAAGTMRVQ